MGGVRRRSFIFFRGKGARVVGDVFFVLGVNWIFRLDME